MATHPGGSRRGIRPTIGASDRPPGTFLQGRGLGAIQERHPFRTSNHMSGSHGRVGRLAALARDGPRGLRMLIAASGAGPGRGLPHQPHTEAGRRRADHATATAPSTPAGPDGDFQQALQTFLKDWHHGHDAGAPPAVTPTARRPRRTPPAAQTLTPPREHPTVANGDQTSPAAARRRPPAPAGPRPPAAPGRDAADADHSPCRRSETPRRPRPSPRRSSRPSP